MTAPVIIEGMAAIFDRETGQVVRCSVPTAVENVANGKGRFVHGDKGDLLSGTAVQAPAAPEPVIALREEGVLDLPAAASDPTQTAEPLAGAPAETRDAIEGRLRPVADDHTHAAALSDDADPLDHDGDGKRGGSTPKAGRSPEEEAERAELFATFKSLGVKVFAGSTTEKLRAKLAEIEAETAPK